MPTKSNRQDFAQLTPGRRALLLLSEEYATAQRQQADPWQYALELPQLLRHLSDITVLQALFLHGLIAHRIEKRRRGGQRRFADPPMPFSFCKRSCFSLTPAGVDFVERKLASGRALAKGKGGAVELAEADLARIKPTFRKSSLDGHRQLKVLSHLLIEFKYFAPIQENYLQAWQDRLWSPLVPNPYAGKPGARAKKRQHDALDHLNRHQSLPLLWLRGDGTGLNATWEWRVDIDENLATF
jgi:hypothetical protein